MPGLPEQMYCSQQIHISPMLPQILRQYAKAAIRTQPTDLLRWSTAYFRALSLNEPPPEKKRLEYPEPQTYMGLTPGFIKVLLNQIGKTPEILISFPDLLYRWEGICMPEAELVKILLTANIDNPISMAWYKVIAVTAGYLTDNLTQTMVLICNLLTEEPDGGSAMIPVDLFLLYYKYLAELDVSERKYVLNVWFYVAPDSFKSGKEVDSVLSPLDKPMEDSDQYSLMSAVPPEFQHLFNPEQQSNIEAEILKRSLESGGFSFPQDANSNPSKNATQEFEIADQADKKSITNDAESIGTDKSSVSHATASTDKSSVSHETISTKKTSISHDTTGTIEEHIILEEEKLSKSIFESEIQSIVTNGESMEIINIPPETESNKAMEDQITMETGTLPESSIGDSKPSETTEDDPEKSTTEDIIKEQIFTSESNEFTPRLSTAKNSDQVDQVMESMAQKGIDPKIMMNPELFQGILSQYSQGPSVASQLLGRTSPHFHLNKYLASVTPSMLTDMESRFTTTNMASDTNTIFREDYRKGATLIVKPPNEQVRYQIDEVRGIGPAVDNETMTTFIKYIEERAAFQHGMIMPRNIINFQCPPLENFKYMTEKMKEHSVDIPFIGCKDIY